MADDDTDHSDDTSSAAADRDGEGGDGGGDGGGDEPTRVARVRYVRSGWGVLFALGVIAGVVIVTSGVADHDTAPFCAEVATAAAATATTVVPPADGVLQQATELAAAQVRLAQYEKYEGLVPYRLEDELELLIDREQRLVAALEALGPDATAEQLDAAVREVDGDEGPLVGEAIFALDIYAAEECDLGAELVD